MPAVREAVAEDTVSQEQAAEVARKISDRLGEHTHYWTVFDPFELEEPVAPILQDDFADIYKDLKNGLVIFDRGSERGVVDAVWQWRFDFENHWGRHVVEALRALHHVIYDYRLPEGS